MRFDNVSFSYGEKTVLRGLSLTLPDTGVTAISGPSGCGKTTLLHLLAGLLVPDSGHIEAPRPCAILFQEDRLLPGLTAGAQLRAVLPKGARPDGYLDAVGLLPERDARIETLSGGMRRRVALARAMAFAAGRKLLILDEPFTGVDPETAKKIMDRLRSMSIPIVFSAHDAESLSMAETILSLKACGL